MVLSVGMTLRLPPSSGVSAPTPWLIEALAAFVVLHVSVVDSPAVIRTGSATSVAVIPVNVPTVLTVAKALAVPASPSAVNR